jgi:hypothetical protein
MAVLRFIYALYLRLTGLSLLAFAGAFFYFSSIGLIDAAVGIWVPAVLAAIGLFLLIPWWLPRGLRRPTQGRDLAWIAIHAVIAALYPMIEGAMISAMASLFTASPEQTNILSSVNSVSSIWWVLPPLAVMLLLVLPSMKRAAPSDMPDPKDPTRTVPTKTKRPGKIPEKKLPALGAAMKLYIVADWTMLRLMGLGLMATAYLIWTLIQADRTGQAELLSHGKAPMTALLVYGGIGAILCLPLLLPQAIARPKNVIFGMVKAILLVAAAYVLIEPMNLAIVEFTPKIYHPTLIETVPRLFKAICGVAVTSALLISFFRQLNGLPAVDYKGDAKVHLSPEQLYDLRKARMGN